MDDFEDDDDSICLAAVDDPDHDDSICLAAIEEEERSPDLDHHTSLVNTAKSTDTETKCRKTEKAADVPVICQPPSCVVPESFPFPFTPYNIQTDFMRDLYTCLDLGKIGIFESPTGTGKSLSLICGALTWLRDFHEKQRQQLAVLNNSKVVPDQNDKQSAKELDWISEFAAKREQEEKLGKVKAEQENIEKREAKLKELQNSSGLVRNRKRKFQMEETFQDLLAGAGSDVKRACLEELSVLEQEVADLNQSEEDGDSQLVLDDYHSDQEDHGKSGTGHIEEEDHVTKVYYCSRTHSQLSQFVREVTKSTFENVRVVSLGSRQSMCINPSVRKLGHTSLINDRCLELQQKKSKSKPGCPFYKQDGLQVFKDKALLEVRDIEDLVSMGREYKTCPYYGSRYAVPQAEVVCLPYNTLLHEKTRQACGIKVEGNVVIIDEAHNLLETINNVHSMEVTGTQVVKAHSQLSQYERKFHARLKAKNLMYVRQILYVLSHLTAVLGGKVDSPAECQENKVEEVRLLTINDFLFRGQLDNLNMFKLLRYCQRSRISKKLHGFVEKYQTGEPKKESDLDKPGMGLTNFLDQIKKSKEKKQPESEAQQTEGQATNKPSWMSSPLTQIENFLEALTNANQDGRVVLHKKNKLNDSSLKFLMLNPAVHFESVVRQARAVVVAGGTMQPVAEFKNQLFHAAGVSPDRILEFSCGHIVPARQLLPLAVSKGPSGLSLDFTYSNRDSPRLMIELGHAMVQLCRLVPGGMVCFFPSYRYQQKVYSHWAREGILRDMEASKKVFQEPQGSGHAERILQDYAQCVQRCMVWQGALNGALLLCVVGGKMSEGINFSDDLGRCVVMVGLPFPNSKSPELQEKMAYLDTHFPKDKEGRSAGQVHYENLCMKAVNQSIGRAIRHKGDYSVIVLLDARYSRPAITSKLPNWISRHLRKEERFGALQDYLPKFFASHKAAT